MAAGGLHVEEVASACTARVCRNVRGESALVCRGCLFYAHSVSVIYMKGGQGGCGRAKGDGLCGEEVFEYGIA